MFFYEVVGLKEKHLAVFTLVRSDEKMRSYFDPNYFIFFNSSSCSTFIHFFRDIYSLTREVCTKANEQSLWKVLSYLNTFVMYFIVLDVTKLLLYFAQACHELVPPEVCNFILPQMNNSLIKRCEMCPFKSIFF